MRKQFLVLGVGMVYFFSAIFFIACNEGSENGDHHENQEHHEDHEHNGHHEEDHEHHDSMHHEEGEHHHDESTKETVYMCPMKCEGDKTYSEAGTCPECGMDLTLVTGDKNKTEEDQHEH